LASCVGIAPERSGRFPADTLKRNRPGSRRPVSLCRGRNALAGVSNRHARDRFGSHRQLNPCFYAALHNIFV
jgi:hypothetical protein